MRRRTVLAGFGSIALAPVTTRAQQPEPMRRVGVLMPFDAQDGFGQDIIAALRRGLRELGWVEGRNIRLDDRWIGGNEERRRTYATELVHSSPSVLFACFQAQLSTLARETRTIPIVFVGVSEPVAGGYAQSIAHPGGNITGFTFFESSMIGLWLAALKEMVPALDRAAIMFNPDNIVRGGAAYRETFNAAAVSVKVAPIVATVRDVGEIESAISVLGQQPNGGLVVAPDTFTTLHHKLIVELAARHRVPATYQFRPAALAGGLLSYGPDQIDIVRRSASYIDRILRGARPGNLPIEGPTKFELVINLKTAKSLGITVPQSLLVRADEVIE